RSKRDWSSDVCSSDLVDDHVVVRGADGDFRQAGESERAIVRPPALKAEIGSVELVHRAELIYAGNGPAGREAAGDAERRERFVSAEAIEQMGVTIADDVVDAGELAGPEEVAEQDAGAGELEVAVDGDRPVEDAGKRRDHRG